MKKDPPVHWICFLLYDRDPEQRWSFGEDRRNETLSYRVVLSRNGKEHATKVVPPCDGPRAHLRALGALMPQVWGLAKDMMDEQFSLWPPADQASLCREFARVAATIASEVEKKAKAIAEDDAEAAEAAENVAKDSIEDLVQA
jgi:hypothetical protein